LGEKRLVEEGGRESRGVSLLSNEEEELELPEEEVAVSVVSMVWQHPRFFDASKSHLAMLKRCVRLWASTFHANLLSKTSACTSSCSDPTECVELHKVFVELPWLPHEQGGDLLIASLVCFRAPRIFQVGFGGCSAEHIMAACERLTPSARHMMTVLRVFHWTR